jgi:hypothetical protein
MVPLATPRLASVASFSGFSPWRTDVSAATGGVRRWWELHALVPRLGLFHGREHEIPYDYGELLRALAPRPVLVWAPQRDRGSSHADVVACVRAANATSGSAITLKTPDTDSRFGNVEMLAYVEFLESVG